MVYAVIVVAAALITLLISLRLKDISGDVTQQTFLHTAAGAVYLIGIAALMVKLFITYCMMRKRDVSMRTTIGYVLMDVILVVVFMIGAVAQASPLLRAILG